MYRTGYCKDKINIVKMSFKTGENCHNGQVWSERGTATTIQICSWLIPIYLTFRTFFLHYAYGSLMKPSS